MTAQQMVDEAAQVMKPVTDEEKQSLILQYGEEIGRAWIKTLASLRLRSAMQELGYA